MTGFLTRGFHLPATALLATTIFSPLTAAAPQEPQGVLEEIVVTATKREQPLQTVPVTVQAFTSEMIKATGARDVTALAGKIPGFAFQDQGPGDKKYIIRGVNSRGEATTGVYFGEAIITGRNKQDGGGRQTDIEMHDLARVEILKGPQGTLFGASSMSGTIRFIPNDPDLQAFSGTAEGEILTSRHGGAGFRSNGSVNVPVIQDKLAVRAVGWLTRDEGYVDNVRLNLRDINNEDTSGGRLSVKFAPTGDLSLTALGLYQKREVDGTGRVNIGGLQEIYADNLIASGLEVVDPVGNLSNQDFTVDNWDDEVQLHSLVGTYATGFGTFLATTNYVKTDVNYRFDSTPILLSFNSPTPALTYQPQSRRIWSSEIRFTSDFKGPFQMVMGGFIDREEQDFEVQVLAVNASGYPSGPWDPETDFYQGTGAAIFGRSKHDDLHQEAVFGELTFNVTEELSLTAGARYFQYRLVSDALETKPFAGFPPNDNPGFSVTNEATKTTLRFNASYQATPDILVYATAAQGFRIGGTNDNAINPGNVDIPASFGPDSLWSYELGWKTRLFHNMITLNGAAYAIRWSDIQVGDFSPSSPFPYVQNAGKASIDGIEVELDIRPVAGLAIFASGSYQDARLTEDFPVPDGVILDPNDELGKKDDRIPNVPKFQFGGSVEYRWPVGGNLTAALRGDLTYRGKTDSLFRTGNGFNVHLAPYTLADLQASIGDDRWRLTAYVKNVTDKLARLDSINSVQDPLAYFVARPRTIGARVSFTF